MTVPRITYPSGSVRERARVLAVRVRGDVADVVVDRTPCHPENPRWPDQPADAIIATVRGERVPATCSEGALAGGAIVDADADADAEGAAGEPVPCVVHHLPAEAAPAAGDEIELAVDAGLRERLSRAHSVCHFGALALNRALADAGGWRKDPGRHDSFGRPDFDALAIQRSTVVADGSTDEYRVGKSLRKKGFVPAALADAPALRAAIAADLRAWLGASPSITLEPGECALADRRRWSSAAGDAPIAFPCGGTHPTGLGPDDVPDVEVDADPDTGTLTLRLRSRR
ncbi:metal-dependent hydrolase [Patulibacter sp. S7RM1-6]